MRIASLLPSATEIVCAIGLQDELVAVTHECDWPPGVSGVRIVVKSGERVDLVWTVPAVSSTAAWLVGCHIPGHWERGMQIPVRWVDAP